MTILRIFIGQEDLSAVNWQIIDNNILADSGCANLTELLLANPEQIEIYLAPSLATIMHVELGEISDRKINDDLLLGIVEDNLAEEIEACKPILLRLNDGIAYIAVINRHFYLLLLEKLANNVKQVKFIQPFPYLANQENDIWTVYLIGKDKFVRTSQYEYFILDDKNPLPELLEMMLESYQQPTINLYSDDSQAAELISSKFQITCKPLSDLSYGVLNWNFYNEKSKRFNLKFSPSTKASLIRLTRVVGVFLSIYIVYWFLNLGFMMYEQNRLRNVVNSDLKGIVTSSGFTPNLLSQVDDKLTDMEHQKGIYAANDMLSLFDVFLKSMPDVNNNMIEGISYSGNQLTVFLSSQYDPATFANDQAIMATKRIKADILDYKSYMAAGASASKNNNGGGVLSNTDSASSGSTAVVQDAAWAVSLQIISRMENINDVSLKKAD